MLTTWDGMKLRNVCGLLSVLKLVALCHIQFHVRWRTDGRQSWHRDPLHNSFVTPCKSRGMSSTVISVNGVAVRNGQQSFRIGVQLGTLVSVWLANYPHVKNKRNSWLTMTYHYWKESVMDNGATRFLFLNMEIVFRQNCFVMKKYIL